MPRALLTLLLVGSISPRIAGARGYNSSGQLGDRSLR